MPLDECFQMVPEDAVLADMQDHHNGTLGASQVQERMQTAADHQEGAIA